jgi:hypothetical protein
VPGDAGEVGGDDAGGMPVKAAVGTVAAHRVENTSSLPALRAAAALAG